MDPNWNTGMPSTVDPNWNAGMPSTMDPSWDTGMSNATPFQTFPSYYNDRADEYTANSIVYPVDYTQYIPGCSETGPSVVAEISVPNWIRQYVVGLCGSNMERITEKLPHIRIIFTQNGNKIVLEGPLKQVQIAEEFLHYFTARVQSTTVVVHFQIDPKFHRHIMHGKGRCKT